MQTEVMNRRFTEERIQMANKHMKGCSVSLVTMEIQIKTIMTVFLSIRLPKMVDFLIELLQGFEELSTFRYY